MDYPVVEVLWVDASFDDAAVPPAELRPLVRLRTAGFLVRDEKEFVCVAAEVCDAAGEVRHVTSIPRACVVRVRRLRK